MSGCQKRCADCAVIVGLDIIYRTSDKGYKEFLHRAGVSASNCPSLFEALIAVLAAKNRLTKQDEANLRARIVPFPKGVKCAAWCLSIPQCPPLYTPVPAPLYLNASLSIPQCLPSCNPMPPSLCRCATLSHTHTITITCTCCCDEIKGIPILIL